MSTGSEAEFVLDRLCESLNRYMRQITAMLPRESGKAKQPSSPSQDEDDDQSQLRRMKSWPCAKGAEEELGPRDEA